MMGADTAAPTTNEDRLLTVRAVGYVVPPQTPGRLPDPRGFDRFRPGQGGVVLNVRLGDPAEGWESDHLEPGVSLAHAEPAATRALQILSCIGNHATVISGAARGERGVVVGKHGTILVHFDRRSLARIVPGDAICIDARGVGLTIDGFPDVTIHSLSPTLLPEIVDIADGRLRLRVVRDLAPALAAAGLGMEAAWANIDLETHDPATSSELEGLRFGDLVALRCQDHRTVRRRDPGWLACGVIAHGASVSGGHGLGMATLLTAPMSQVEVVIDPDATLSHLISDIGGVSV
jgi:hypothetical protein